MVGQEHKRINRERMLAAHGDDRFAEDVPADVSTEPGIALICDVGEEVATTRSIEAAVIWHGNGRNGWYKSAHLFRL